MRDALAAVREPLAAKLASLALFSEIHPIESGWLLAFVREADVDTRVQWTQQIAHGLDSLDPREREQAWDRWIRSFWEGRAVGVPVPLEDSERRAMLGWALVLGPRLPDAVAMVLLGPVRGIEEFWFADLQHNRANLLREHPDAMSRLLLHVLRGIAQLQWVFDELTSVVRALHAAGAPRDALRQICDRLAELGHPSAMDLRMLIDGGAEAA